MIQMVNGFPCANCTDVSLARRGIDPENPTNDPVKAEEIANRSGRAVMPATVFDGLLAPFDADRIRRAGGLPDATKPSWRLVDITA